MDRYRAYAAQTGWSVSRAEGTAGALQGVFWAQETHEPAIPSPEHMANTCERSTGQMHVGSESEVGMGGAHPL